MLTPHPYCHMRLTDVKNFELLKLGKMHLPKKYIADMYYYFYKIYLFYNIILKIIIILLYLYTRNSGCYMPFFLAPAEAFGSPSGSQWWPLATTMVTKKNVYFEDHFIR